MDTEALHPLHVALVQQKQDLTELRTQVKRERQPYEIKRQALKEQYQTLKRKREQEETKKEQELERVLKISRTEEEIHCHALVEQCKAQEHKRDCTEEEFLLPIGLVAVKQVYQKWWDDDSKTNSLVIAQCHEIGTVLEDDVKDWKGFTSINQDVEELGIMICCRGSITYYGEGVELQDTLDTSNLKEALEVTSDVELAFVKPPEDVHEFMELLGEGKLDDDEQHDMVVDLIQEVDVNLMFPDKIYNRVKLEDSIDKDIIKEIERRDLNTLSYREARNVEYFETLYPRFIWNEVMQLLCFKK